MLTLQTTVDSETSGILNSVHFLIGSEALRESYISAAVIAKHLASQIPGTVTQHREEQGEESKAFLSYFPKGIHYISREVASIEKYSFLMSYMAYNTYQTYRNCRSTLTLNYYSRDPKI